MSKTVVGLFSTMQQANQVKQKLVSDGYEADNIKIVANDAENASEDSSATANPTGYTDIGSGGGAGIGEKISHFFRSLAGGDDAAHHHYAKGVNEGGALLAVTVPDEEASEAASLLNEYGARDIDESDEGSAATTAAAYQGDSTTGTGETAIPVIEEELVVGKRAVDRGGVRVYSHVTERPVDTDVTLREERINIERRPVDRPATAADFAAGNAASIELTATGEEAVVGKNSRVVEEVVVGKESSQRTEAIHDTVRRTEVEVEEIEGETVGAVTPKSQVQ